MSYCIFYVTILKITGDMKTSESFCANLAAFDFVQVNKYLILQLLSAIQTSNIKNVKLFSLQWLKFPFEYFIYGMDAAAGG